MAVPDQTIWARDPHTEAKHRVLAGYFNAWFPIMLRTWPRLTVFEGYAGPGEYSDGEEGSPLIALRCLLDRPQLVGYGKPVRFVFVEERKDRLDHLRSLVAQKFDLPGHVAVDFINGACEDVWAKVLAEAHAWGQPIFANLDPFGPGVPFELVQRIGNNKSSEVLVTFMSDWLRRFAGVEHLEDGDIQFGGHVWRQVTEVGSAEDKELFLVNEYANTLGRAGLGLTARFRLSDEGGRSFYLIFGTGHRRGLERMKESMWKIDAVAGIRFRDPSDPEQGVLDLGEAAPDLASLRRQLKVVLVASSGGQATVEELRDIALFQTGFRPPHATAAIRQLLAANELGRQPEGGRLSGSVRVRLF